MKRGAALPEFMTSSGTLVGSSSAPIAGSAVRAVPNKRRTAVMYGLIGLLVCIHLMPLGSPLPWWQRLLGAIPGVLAARACFAYLDRGERRLPLLEYALVRIYVEYGLGTVVYDSDVVAFPFKRNGMAEALLAITVFLVIMLGTYRLGRRMGQRIAPMMDRCLPRNIGRGVRYLIPFWVASAVYANVAPGFVPLPVRQIVTIMGGYGPMYAYLYLEAARAQGLQRRNALARILFVTAILGGSGLLSGSFEQVITPMVLAGLLSIGILRSIPWRYIVIAIGLYVVLQPAKASYRDVAWSPRGKEASPSAKVGFWVDALKDAWLDRQEYTEHRTAMFQRLSQLALTAYAFEMVPDPIPHDSGKKWAYLPQAVVPRIVLRSKMNITEEFNNYFNITFGFQTQEGTEGNCNSFPVFIDGYWNFGWWGVAFVGAVVGWLLGILTGGIPLTSWGGLSVAIAAMMNLRCTDFIVGQLAGELQTVVGMGIFCWGVSLVLGRPSERAPSAR